MKTMIGGMYEIAEAYGYDDELKWCLAEVLEVTSDGKDALVYVRGVGELWINTNRLRRQ